MSRTPKTNTIKNAISFDVDSFLDEFEHKKDQTKSTHYMHKKAKLNYNQRCIFVRLCQHHTPQQQLDSVYQKIFKTFRLSVMNSDSEWVLNINHQNIESNDAQKFETLQSLCAPPLTINIVPKRRMNLDIHFNQHSFHYAIDNNKRDYDDMISQISNEFGLSKNEILLYETIDEDHICIEDNEDLDMILSEFDNQTQNKGPKDFKIDLYVMKLSFEESLEQVITKMHTDGIKFLCFETPNVSGQSIGSMVPSRNCEKVLRSGYQFALAELILSVNNGKAKYVIGEDAVLNSTGYGNVNSFAYLDTYKIIPWLDGDKTAMITTHQLTECDKTLPTDTRTLCVYLLRTLHDEFGLDIYHTIEHEFLILNKRTQLPVTESGCYRVEKLQPVHEFLCVVDDYMQSMNINCERYHAEVGSGQYETSIVPAWNIKGADDAYWFKNGIRQIATKHNKDWSVSFVPFPYVDSDQKPEPGLIDYDPFKAANGAHFNHSLWSTNGNGERVSALCDAQGTHGLSDVCMYWIGGIMKHIRAITAFVCPTAVCYRRLKKYKVNVADWGINTRKTMISVRMSEQNTYLEFRLPSSLVNPYLVLSSVMCAGMDGVRNKILPNDVSENDKKIPQDFNDALNALEGNEVFKKAFGELFVNCYIEIKRIEIDEFKEYKKKNQRPLLYTLM
eukprot:62348_1